MASIFHASRHFVLFSIGFARVVIDSLISFNYKVNDFSAPPRAGYSLLSAIKAVVEVDDRVTNQRPCRNTHHIQTSPSSSGSPSLRGASYTNSIPQPLINFADIESRLNSDSKVKAEIVPFRSPRSIKHLECTQACFIETMHHRCGCRSLS